MGDFEGVRALAAEDIGRLEPLWGELYAHQAAHGMLLRVSPDGFAKWRAGLQPVLGRFACLFIAEAGSEAAGFLCGRIRSVPPYFGGALTGFISEVYVRDTHRGHKFGRKLVDNAIQWFEAQKISRVELQVLSANPEARNVYKHLGWTEELVQMVWEPPSRSS